MFACHLKSVQDNRTEFALRGLYKAKTHTEFS